MTGGCQSRTCCGVGNEAWKGFEMNDSPTMELTSVCMDSEWLWVVPPLGLGVLQVQFNLKPPL